MPVIALLGGIVFYALASLGVRAKRHALERAARVGAIALNAGLNVVIWAWIQPAWGALLGGALGAIGLMSAVPPIARRRRFQALLGWASWLMPMSWLATGAGLVLFAAVLIASPWLRTVRVRLDPSTGAIETSGLPRIGFRGGFNLGNFTFLLGTPPTPFTAAGISSHETGHTLNVAAFGSVWHLIGNGVEQNLWPFRRGAHAYGELLAESRRPDSAQPTLPHWS